MNLPNRANFPNLAKMFTFYTKYYKLSSKCSEYRFKAFLIVNFDKLKRFLILPEFSKLG